MDLTLIEDGDKKDTAIKPNIYSDKYSGGKLLKEGGRKCSCVQICLCKGKVLNY